MTRREEEPVRWRRRRWAGGVAVRIACVAAAALGGTTARAGPPFLTDDPEPTDTGRWEVYAPTIEAAGRGRDYEGSYGAELNYGAAPGVQVTLGLPVHYVHDDRGLTTGAGELRLSVKMRFFHDEERGVSIAAFPGVTLPTAGRGLGSPTVTALLPVWLQKNSGAWSVFGGGGYAINPGAGNRNFWTGGAALTRAFSDRVLVGIEADRAGADTVDGRASTSFGLGAIVRFTSHVRVLGSAGPTYEEGTAAPRFHVYLAVGLDF